MHKKITFLVLFYAVTQQLMSLVTTPYSKVSLTEMSEPNGISTHESTNYQLYDFSGSSVINGNFTWTLTKKDSVFYETFLNNRVAYAKRDCDIVLTAEENRLKYISYGQGLPIRAVKDGISRTFTASGRYCKTQPLYITGDYQASDTTCTVILSVGDTITNALSRSITLKYKGVIGDYDDFVLANDSVESYSRTITHIFPDGTDIPCAVILETVVMDNSNKVIHNENRYFIDRQAPVRLLPRQCEESTDVHDAESFEINYAGGIVSMRSAGYHTDLSMAVMDASGNIYCSTSVTNERTASLDVSALPFGQYIVSIASLSSGIAHKQIIFIH